MKPLQEVPVTELQGVGPALAEKLNRLGLFSLQDLLFHLPLRYEDRTQISALGQLRVGSTAVVEGEVISCEVSQGRRRSLLARIRDGSGLLSLRFFHFSASMKSQLQPGKRVRCYGEARPGATGLEIYHPEFRVLRDDQPPPALEQLLTPVYPVTEGLQQKRLRQLITAALQQMQEQPLDELLPQHLLQASQFAFLADWSLAAAIHYLHHPPADADLMTLSEGLHPAQRRLALEELLAQQLGMLALRQKVREEAAHPLRVESSTLEIRLLEQLPFQLTGAQRRVVSEVSQDLGLAHPMLRLVQGDVGSGKTLVAALACLKALASHCQAAIMAPTELLAEQHYQNLKTWLEPLGIRVEWLTGKLKGKLREALLKDLASGAIQLLVGTHALFQEEVAFAKLALVVIDEQHRFGVHQRLALRDKGKSGDYLPHQLVMTATPIPRTLAMSAYADLDVSVIDELPPGRQPVKTLVLPDSRRPEVIARVRSACEEGRQAYWVCTLIEESEVLECQAAEVTWQELQVALPDLNIALVHGRMKPAEKADVMAAFKAGSYQLLVATTVIEVGVDVPNASLMIIDNAERLGLAQLHQLRGRVGRGSTASYCTLIYHPPLSQQGRERLQAMRSTNDGFAIAQKDLEIRGPGELLGTRQTGEVQLRLASLKRDAHLLEGLKPLAIQLQRESPEQAKLLLKRWRGNSLHFAQV
ncbi:ATP-dependent DNA helicase RecG [Marinospirillum celere]|uniref:ATP-dependent DNA helicase RecG n=1 Tax=Marinospirillum celere TaxID=1122252 RepID=A0A1I1JI37_9GAMM|nr:ATP-dependent DNA helicase RecG [Marinospirillum celere]SFC48015.1 ATP-dependent DNA helicase RecG [Marinospirillum celere]